MNKRENPIYKVIFLNQGQVFEMYAKQIYQSDLWGFLEIEEFVFGERTQVVVDPSEEKLKAQFEGVLRSFVPMHAIVRIDEVERLGTPKISEAKGAGNVMPLFAGTPSPRKNMVPRWYWAWAWPCSEAFSNQLRAAWRSRGMRSPS